MKLRKVFSVLCAITMLTSALPAASAAEAKSLSKYAGQTIPVQAVEMTESGPVSRIIEVAIPDNATEAEEDALIYSAAFGHNIAAARSASETMALLSDERDLTINQDYQRVGGGLVSAGTLRQTFIRAQISAAGHFGASLIFQVRDVRTPDIAPPPYTIKIDPNVLEFAINCGGMPSTDKGINVFCKTNFSGTVDLSYCRVYAVL